MKITVSNCCHCTCEGMPCVGLSCKNYLPYDTLVCDECSEECEVLYVFEQKEICENCLHGKFSHITL